MQYRVIAFYLLDRLARIQYLLGENSALMRQPSRTKTQGPKKYRSSWLKRSAKLFSTKSSCPETT
jgi:hypothetical protein